MANEFFFVILLAKCDWLYIP